MSVTLRQRLKGGKVSLYLDYYYSKGQREYEFLKLYLLPEPQKGSLSKEQKDSNRQTLALAEAIRSKRHLELQNGVYGFRDKERAKGSFLSYVEYLKGQRDTSKGNSGIWRSMLRHLKKYAKYDVTFDQVNREWLEGFKVYLGKEARTPSGKLLSQNSQAAYYSKLSSAVKQASKDRIILTNPTQETAGIKVRETERSFLSYDELQNMAKAPCDVPLLKRAFLFSALCGLRWSDVEKLKWSEVQYSQELGHILRFRQRKTKAAETLPISEQAFQLLGERGAQESRVFEGLKYSAWNNLKLAQWAMRAGVAKPISFNSARHSYATLQITLGTDLFVVSKLLGHRSIRTTEVYARVIDQKKREAANKIKLKL